VRTRRRGKHKENINDLDRVIPEWQEDEEKNRKKSENAREARTDDLITVSTLIFQ
jgi:hypothetical protein